MGPFFYLYSSLNGWKFWLPKEKNADAMFKKYGFTAGSPLIRQVSIEWNQRVNFA